jgi:hypothetical protein
MASDEEREQSPPHLGDDRPWIRWNWSREDPVEIVLLVFVLVLFFLLPRPGCGIDNKGGDVSDGAPASIRASNN